MNQTRFGVSYLLLFLLIAILLQNLWLSTTMTETISYSRFEKLLSEDRIAEVKISDSKISGRLKEPRPGEKELFVTQRIDPELAKQFTNKEVSVFGDSDDSFIKELISWILPILIFAAIWFALMRFAMKKSDLGGSFMTVGKSKAKIYVEDDTKKTFQDVAGVDEAKEELREVVGFLKDPSHYTRLGARLPKGILLVGPPGTGKTLLARAVAGEAGVPFFSISGSEFVEMFVGVGAARVRDLFIQARAKAPCIIFIDELDALGKVRSFAKISGNDEKEQTLNQLLVELDGFDTKSGVVILSATNRPEILDPALLRAGRFDRQVLIDRPDKKGRLQILEVHIHKISQIGENLNLDLIAGMTTGFSGADLENLVNEAALVATRKNKASVDTEDFSQAIERIVAGLERRNRVLNEKERRIVAHHEMGHAIMGALLPSTEKLHKVSIIPRGVGALGYTIQRPIEDRFLMTKTELENKITVLLGGRAAEDVIFGHLSTGASDDISKASNIARSMVTRYGMCEEVGYISFDEQSSQFLGAVPGENNVNAYSEDTRRKIDQAVKSIVDHCYEKSRKLLALNIEVLKTGAQRLLEKETLGENDLAKIFVELKKESL